MLLSRMQFTKLLERDKKRWNKLELSVFFTKIVVDVCGSIYHINAVALCASSK